MKELKIKHITPLFTSIITTMDKYEDDVVSNGLISSKQRKGCLKEYQKVLSVGSCVRDIKVGDVVSINPTRFAVKKHKEGSLKDGIVTDNPVTEYNFDIVVMDDIQCLLLQDRDIDFIIDDYEFVDVVDTKPSNLVLPEEKKIITLS